MHQRSGQSIAQPTGYRAFIPTPLPPDPPIAIDGPFNQLLAEANMAIGSLDTMGYLLPNVNHVIAMYVRKEALLSSLSEKVFLHLANMDLSMTLTSWQIIFSPSKKEPYKKN